MRAAIDGLGASCAGRHARFGLVGRSHGGEHARSRWCPNAAGSAGHAHASTAVNLGRWRVCGSVGGLGGVVAKMGKSAFGTGITFSARQGFPETAPPLDRGTNVWLAQSLAATQQRL